MPSVPHVDAAVATQVFDGSGAPAGTSAQVPIAPGSVQDLHAPAQAVAQQTPCAQKPESHSTAAEHEAPLVFLPHELCASHTLGGTQAASLVHAEKQRVPLQAKGAQASDGGATHCPVLLHAEAGVKTLESQLSPAQGVPALYLRQLPAPSQTPSVPQVAAPWSAQVPRGSAAPAGTGVQRPIADGSPQDRQAPWHASAQQTPSTQKVLAHSPPVTQVWPFCLGPQLPATQAWPAWQSASEAHLVLHAPFVQRNGAHVCTPGARHTPTPLQVPAVSRRSPAHAGGMQMVSAR
jgi:hypothetical protein